MQGLAGLLVFPYLALLGWLGYHHNAAWLPLPIAAVGLALFFIIRPGALTAQLRSSSIPNMAILYLTQVVPAYIAFGIGWAIGAI